MSSKSTEKEGVETVEQPAQEVKNESQPSFTTTFDHFLNFADKVLQYNITGDLVLTSTGNQSNAIQTSLANYRKVYNQTRESSKHIEKFGEVYARCRLQFLNEISIDDFMDWFQKTSFVISPQEKSRSRILLTAISFS